MLAALSSPAHANTLKVTNKQNSGPGSLRYAINHAAPRGDTITFASGVSGTIVLGGELEISKNLTIRGPGADKLAISGNNRNRAFYIDYGKTVTISGLTIAKGYEDYFNDGGGIYSDTDFPAKTLISNSTVSGNRVTLANSVGGGVYNGGGLTEIKNSTITNNAAPQGGGVANYDGLADLSTRVFSTIIADNDGGFGSARDFVSNGYNLIGSGEAGVANKFNKAGDRVAVSEPGLGILADNGGPRGPTAS
jgi:hypothetical protein